jgi:orotidine-5'-phosphate decarboxylase
MDVPTCDSAKELANELGDSVTFYKIGLELMMSGEYFDLLDWMLARNKKVFCDLKFFDKTEARHSLPCMAIVPSWKPLPRTRAIA